MPTSAARELPAVLGKRLHLAARVLASLPCRPALELRHDRFQSVDFCREASEWIRRPVAAYEPQGRRLVLRSRFLARLHDRLGDMARDNVDRLELVARR